MHAINHQTSNIPSPAVMAARAVHPAGHKKRGAPLRTVTTLTSQDTPDANPSGKPPQNPKGATPMHTTAQTAAALQISAHLAIIEAQLEALALQIETEHSPVVPDDLMANLARDTNEALRHVATAFNKLHPITTGEKRK